MAKSDVCIHYSEESQSSENDQHGIVHSQQANTMKQFYGDPRWSEEDLSQLWLLIETSHFFWPRLNRYIYE